MNVAVAPRTRARLTKITIFTILNSLPIHAIIESSSRSTRSNQNNSYFPPGEVCWMGEKKFSLTRLSKGVCNFVNQGEWQMHIGQKKNKPGVIDVDNVFVQGDYSSIWPVQSAVRSKEGKFVFVSGAVDDSVDVPHSRAVSQSDQGSFLAHYTLEQRY